MSTDKNNKITRTYGPMWQSKKDWMGIRFNNDGGDGTGAGDSTDSNSGSATDNESLGAAGKAALAAERKARAAAEKELAAFRKAQKDAEDKDLSESQRLTRELETERAEKAKTASELLRFKVASTIDNFPLSLVPRLQGDDEASIKADAEAIVKQFNIGGPRVPKADPSAGKKHSASGLTPAQQFEDAIDGLFDNQ